MLTLRLKSGSIQEYKWDNLYELKNCNAYFFNYDDLKILEASGDSLKYIYENLCFSDMYCFTNTLNNRYDIPFIFTGDIALMIFLNLLTLWQREK